jgi:hypothetical protein
MNKTEAPNFGQQDLDIKFRTGVNEGTPTESLKIPEGNHNP